MKDEIKKIDDALSGKSKGYILDDTPVVYEDKEKPKEKKQ